MRKLLFLPFVLGLAGEAAAQATPTPTPAPETYTVSATSQRVTELTQILNARNEKTCERLHRQAGTNPWTPPTTCTQGQACTVGGAAGGASCTAAQARAANVRLWPLTQAGRDEYVTFAIASPAFNDQLLAVPGWEQYQQCQFWQTANQTQRDDMCTKAGRQPGCRLYGTSCQ